MRPSPSTPSLARLPALILGLALSVSVSFAIAADTLPDIQRLMKQGQMPQALEKVDTYISTKPKDAQGRFLKGLILTEMGRPAEAIPVFTKLTEDYPELPEPYNNLAVLYAQQKQYDKARTALEMAIRTHPSYSIAHENLGDVYAKLASQAYDKALQLDSSNSVTQSKLSLIRELISTSAKPGVKPSATATRPTTEPVKVAVAEPVKPVAAPAQPSAAVVTPVAAPAKPVEKAPEPAKVEKPAEKSPEVKAASAAPAKPAAAEGGSEAEVTKSLQGWASAWSHKDVKGYLSHYASDFQTPNGMPRKAWEAERAQRIDKPGKLQVSVDDIKVSIAGDKATVKFRQHYNSASLKTTASKTVVFVRSGGKWLIQQERVG
jgi:tetratricopeptide (TPR) repeat protein